MPWESQWKPAEELECPNCGEKEVIYRDWISYDEAHEDTCFSCNSCKHLWWVEGSDA